MSCVHADCADPLGHVHAEDLKPLHVKVAEALGCAPIWGSGWYGGKLHGETWLCRCDEGQHGFDSQAEGSSVTKRYDTDWSATGPLIEKCGFSVDKRGWCWRAMLVEPDLSFVHEFAEMPLIAVCHLILALKEAGKL